MYMIKRICALVFAFTLLFAFAVPASADYQDSPEFVIPAGFTTYEYIQSDGTGWLETDVRPTERTGVWFDGQLIDNTGTGKYVFGSKANTSSASDDRYNFAVDFVSNSPSFNINKSGTTSKQVVVADDLARMYFSLNSSNQYVIGGSSGTLLGTGAAFTSIYPCYIFALNNGGNVTGQSVFRVYRFQFFDGDTLIRDLYPASNSDGTYGLLDAIDGGFYPVSVTGTFTVGDITGIGTPSGPNVAEIITDLNTQIHDIESTIYEDLHTYSAEVDPSTATNFSGNFLSAMSFISDTWTSAYNQLGDMQVIVTFPLFLAIAMLFIGRMNSVIASGAMKSRKNNDKKGGGDVG